MATCRHDECSEAVCGDFACVYFISTPPKETTQSSRAYGMKAAQDQRKIKAGDLNFEGTNIYDVDASDVSIPGQNNAFFKNATILKRRRSKRASGLKERR